MILLFCFVAISAVLLIGCLLSCDLFISSPQCFVQSFPPAGELQNTVTILNRSQAIGAYNAKSCSIIYIHNYSFLSYCQHVKTMGRHCVGIIDLWSCYGFACQYIAIIGLAVSVGVLT